MCLLHVGSAVVRLQHACDLLHGTSIVAVSFFAIACKQKQMTLYHHQMFGSSFRGGLRQQWLDGSAVLRTGAADWLPILHCLCFSCLWIFLGSNDFVGLQFIGLMPFLHIGSGSNESAVVRFIGCPPMMRFWCLFATGTKVMQCICTIIVDWMCFIEEQCRTILVCSPSLVLNVRDWKHACGNNSTFVCGRLIQDLSRQSYSMIFNASQEQCWLVQHTQTFTELLHFFCVLEQCCQWCVHQARPILHPSLQVDQW